MSSWAADHDPDFRSLPPKVQEEIAGTSYETLKNIYDHVTADDMRDAWEQVQARKRAAAGSKG